MPIQELFEAIKKVDLSTIKFLIGEKLVDINVVHHIMKLRAIDYAARLHYSSVVELLIALGANIFPQEEQKVLGPNIVLATLHVGEEPFYKIFTKDSTLKILNSHGITMDHINAAYGQRPAANADLTCEDEDGLLPVHYAAYCRSRNFISWLPTQYQDSFPNYILTKGKYIGTSGAWWMASSVEVGKLLIDAPHDKSKINLNEKGVTYFDCYQSLLFKLLSTAYGCDYLIELPQNIFNNIDWDQQELGTPAAMHMCHSREHAAAFFNLPQEILIKINWNAYGNSKSDIPFIYKLLESSNPSIRRKLIAFPAEVLERIEWLSLVKKGENIYDYPIQLLINNLPAAEIALFLAKLSTETLQKIYYKLDNLNPAIHHIGVELLQRDLRNIPQDPLSEYPPVVKEFYEQLLLRISIIFEELQDPSFRKKLKGLKGQFLDRFSVHSELCSVVLNMLDPFFKTTASFNTLTDVEKVKALAMKYLMQGESIDKIQGCNIVAGLFRKKDSKSSLDKRDHLSRNPG